MTVVIHKDDVPWYAAPAPPRRHQHFAQTVGVMSDDLVVWRCACGAFGGPGERWHMLRPDRPRVAPRRGLVALLLRRRG